MVYNFRYQAEIDLDGNDITIFGKVLPTNLSDKTHVISCYYNGTSWEVDFLIDVTEDNSLPFSVIEENPFKIVPSSPEIMINGDYSPSIYNDVQGEGTTDSKLYYRCHPTEKEIEIYGFINVYDIDETAVSGTFSVIIASFASSSGSYALLPYLGGSISIRIPVLLEYSSASNTTTDSVVGGYLSKAPTFANITLVIPPSTLGTSTNATYKTMVYFKLLYQE